MKESHENMSDELGWARCEGSPPALVTFADGAELVHDMLTIAQASAVDLFGAHQVTPEIVLAVYDRMKSAATG